jgi:non-specific serine/threonine protein kinase
MDIIDTSIILKPEQFLVFGDSEKEWIEDLFNLGALRQRTASQVVYFWRTFSANYIQRLCRLPDDVSPLMQEPISQNELQDFVSGAPPMQGGEYLNTDCLFKIWTDLAIWTALQLSQNNKTLSEFLALRAPLWRRVGRLTFHLAENKANPDKPFAFMVTFVPTLTADGRDRHAPIKSAILHYSKEKDRESFVRLLTPVKIAAEKLPWVRELDEHGGLYNPQQWDIDQAYRFLKDIPILEESGLTVRIPNWWRNKPKVRVKIVVGENNVPAMGLNSILDWDVKLAVGDQNLSASEIEQFLAGAYTGDLIFFKGQWLEANKEQLSQALSHWIEAREASNKSGITFLEAMRLLSGFPQTQGSLAEGKSFPEPGPWVQAEAGAALQEVINQLKDPEASKPPPELSATLRPYQKEGLSWLACLTRMGLGGCLADDMGLGKTIQVLALLLLEIKAHSKGKSKKPLTPSLLVAPASLLANWRTEAARFTPTLRLKIYHPSESSKELINQWEKDPSTLTSDCDLVITSYALLYRRFDFFKSINFRLAILDEAQAIKNPTTNQSKAVRDIKSKARLILTGTPIENRLTDLWSLFDFINPGLLGSQTRFKEVVLELEKRKEDQYGPLRRLIAPYLLRRLKTDRRIINDLPDKVETTLYCHLTQHQAVLYKKIVDKLAYDLKAFSHSNQDQMKRKGHVLKSLLRLKQLINHPAQLTGDNDWREERSGKFQRIAELGKELAERQERLLVFTQYREIIPALDDHLANIFGRQGVTLHGGTPVKRRMELVNEFQSQDGPPYFILSLKAGGTGLNLTAAGQVIHFDRWWNPAVEDQATDRAYRIGQKRNVLVHKCVTRGTLEERIDKLLTEKRGLAEEVLGTGAEISLVNLDDKALLELVSLDIDQAVIR